jgi:hopanoid biosynthesis associated RND transporter like protein HpnN
VTAAVVELVCRRPRTLLALLGALSVGLGAYAALNLGVNADPQSMVSADLPFRVQEREFNESFRAANDEFLMLVDGDSAAVAGRAAEALAERLRAQPELFERVIVVGGGAFYDRNALLYLGVAELEEFVDRLAAVQPFLAEIARDPSLVGLGNLLRQAVAAQREGEDLGMDLAGALDRVSAAAEAAREGRAAPDPWGDALIGGEMSEEARHRVVSAVARRHYDQLLNAEPVVAAIQRAAADLELTREHGVEVRLTGTEVLNYEELALVTNQGRWVGVASFVLFGVAISFAMRSPGLVFAQLAALVAGLLWTNAFAAAAVGQLNQVSVAFNVLIIGLGGELGIHFALRYAELAGQGMARVPALVETARSIGSSLVSSAGTTSIGFLVFLPTDYRGVAELGLISGAGVLLSLLATFTVLPAVLCLVRSPGPRPARDWLLRLEHVPVRRARAIRWGALAVGVGAALLAPRIHFDHNPIHLRDPASPAVQAFRDLVARSEVTPWAIDVVLPNLAEAERMAEELERLPTVKAAVTLADFVPAQQAEKREILAGAALFLPPTAGTPAQPDAGAELEALAALERELARPDGAGDARLAAAQARLASALRGFREAAAAADSPDALLARLRENAVGSLPDQLADLGQALSPEAVTLANLPPEIRDQMLAPDGRARVQVFPVKDVFVGAALDEFMGAVSAVAPNVTGPAVNLVNWGEVTSGAMEQALAVGLACMFAFLFVLWRNLWDSLLAFFPLALASLASVAVMVLFGQPFNFANVIVLPMLIGMGVDNGVHLVHRHRTNPEEVDVLATSTARAVFFAALTTVLCFGSLAFASHRGMAALGQMLTLGVAATLVCYVVVLPAVLALDDELRRRRRA